MPVVSPAQPSVSAKAVILTEAFILFTATIAIHRSRGEAWVDIWTKTAVKAAIGTVIILMILLTAADLGAGNVAIMFGGLIVIGYLLTAFGTLGPALAQLEQTYLGAPPPLPLVPLSTSKLGSSTSPR